MKNNATTMLRLAMALLVMLFISCGDDDNKAASATNEEFIRAADMSFLPEIEAAGIQFKNNGQTQDALQTLKDAGVNTIRIRLWKNPASPTSGFDQVKAFAQRVKGMDMKVWLTVHYSDTWADPANQVKPAEWQNLPWSGLKGAVEDYTAKIATEINPDIFQIGNETNSGFIYPEGNLLTDPAGFLGLAKAASVVIRAKSPKTKIMLHYAGLGDQAAWFFSRIAEVDYDYIGLSYYPVDHGKDLEALKSTITSLGKAHNKRVLIAETAYPFTLGWNDYTNNVVGLDTQIIPDYPATPQGQLDYVLAIRNVVETSGAGLGFCYWGAEWVAFKGPQATNGSSFENQALWDFDYNALPALGAFAQ